MTPLGYTCDALAIEHPRNVVGSEFEPQAHDSVTLDPLRRLRRILLVTSIPERRQSLRAWLEPRGYGVHEATDIDHAEQMISGRRTFDGVVCDHRLEDGDGLQFMRRLRRNAFSMPFILLTNWLLPGLKSRWDFDFLVAPLDGDTVARCLGNLLGAGSSTDAEPAPANITAFPTILGDEEACA